MSEFMPKRDYGRQVGPFWWHYNLSAAARFMADAALHGHPWELRFWGATIGPFAVGILRKEKREANPMNPVNSG